MILLYGAGGGPGRGEIPMDPIRYRASDAFLFCTWGFEEKLSAATKAQRQTGIGRALRFGGSYTRFKSDPKGGKTYGINAKTGNMTIGLLHICLTWLW